MAPGATWIRSAMTSAGAPARSAAPATPGSRVSNGRMALKRWVKPAAPAARAARVSSSLASLWPIWQRQPASVAARRKAKPGSISGAMVSTRTGTRAASSRNKARSGGRAKGGWAPIRCGLMKGPSRCRPSIRASPGSGAAMTAATPSAACSRSSSGAVTVVGSRLVVPCRAWKEARRRTSASPRIVSAPPPPWTCRSTKPGTTSGAVSSAAADSTPRISRSNRTRAARSPSGVTIRPTSSSKGGLSCMIQWRTELRRPPATYKGAGPPPSALGHAGRVVGRLLT